MNSARARLSALLLLCLAPAHATPSGGVLTGIDVLQRDAFKPLIGKRVGLITNQTGIDRSGRSIVDIFARTSEVRLEALFSPEHGLRGVLEVEDIASGTYPLPGGRRIPLYSLYGATKAPTNTMLEGLDALVFDIQGIGARFYTYSTTMAMAMEAAAAAGIEFVVLDRPNPIGGRKVAGAALDPGIRAFIAYLPVSVRHGMTMGELARLHNHTAGLKAKLTVVPLEGWQRDLWFDETGLPWVRPSPNMPDLDSATLYPGTGNFENSNVSVGRGTPAPFRWIGAPWMDSRSLLARLRKARLPGVSFSAQTYTPAKSVYAGKPCPGILMKITDRERLEPMRLFAHLVTALRDLHPKEFNIREKRMAQMIGTHVFNSLYHSGAEAEVIRYLFETRAEAFRESRLVYLLY